MAHNQPQRGPNHFIHISGFRSRAVLNGKLFSSALSFIHSICRSFLSSIGRWAVWKWEWGQPLLLYLTKDWKKEREREADGCHGEKERGDPRQMTCSFTLKSFIPLHLAQSTSCQHLSITVCIKQHNRSSNHQRAFGGWSMMASTFNRWDKSDDKIIRLFWS